MCYRQHCSDAARHWRKVIRACMVTANERKRFDVVLQKSSQSGRQTAAHSLGIHSAADALAGYGILV
jgi:hypothetical protein